MAYWFQSRWEQCSVMLTKGTRLCYLADRERVSDLKVDPLEENKDYVLVRTRMLQVDYEQTAPVSHKVYEKSQGRQKVPPVAWLFFFPHSLRCCTAERDARNEFRPRHHSI